MIQRIINNIKRKIFVNAFWAVISTIVSKGINFIVITAVANFLGPKLFGTYNVVQLAVGMFGTIAGLGLGLAATKLVAEYKSKDFEETGRIISSLYFISLVLSLITSVIFFGSASYFSEVLNNKELLILLKYTSLIVIFDSVIGVQNGILTGFEMFKEITAINFIIGILSAPILIYGAQYFELLGLTLALLLTRVINLIVNQIYVNRIFSQYSFKIRPKVYFNNFRAIFGISLPSFLSSLATTPINLISTSIFVNQPSGYHSLGSFNVANQLRNLVLMLPDSAGKVTIPQLANQFGSLEFNKFFKTAIFTIIWNFILSTVAALGLYLFIDFYKDLFSEGYYLSNNLIIIVLTTGIVISLTNSVGYIFICSNLIWIDFFLRIFWGISVVTLTFFFHGYNGPEGFALPILGASLIHIFTQVLVIFYHFKFR